VSADNYIFIDQETFAVYHRFASVIYGGQDVNSIYDQAPAYQGSSYKDAACWATHFEPNEYGVYVGTLCPDCQKEVSLDEQSYPSCQDCLAKHHALLANKRLSQSSQ